MSLLPFAANDPPMDPAAVHWRRRRFAGGLLGLLAGATVHAADTGRVVLDRAEHLPRELARALAAGKPLVVMVSLPGCPFCREARDSYLGPLRDAQQQPIVQVDMRSTQALVALDGGATTHDAMVRGWRVSIAPTVLFIGPGGKEVAPRLAGGYLPDFYGAYLDERMDAAMRSVKR